MATNPKKRINSKNTSNMDCSSHSDESSTEVPMPHIEPKSSASITGAKTKNATKIRGKNKKTPEQVSSPYELVWDMPDSNPNNIISNKCKIGESCCILTIH